ncbi:MAG: hypothetical protein AB8B48_15685 [Pseudomonadales bacterium]
MNNIDSTYLYIGIASFVVIAVYMIEHENASRAYKDLLKKPYSHHVENMFFVVFFCIVVLFAYISLVAAIYCAIRLIKGWLGFSILSKNDKRKLDSEMMIERRQNSIARLLGKLPYNGGLSETGGIPPNATYPQAMAYVAIWLADNYAEKTELAEQIDHCKRYWLSLRYSDPSHDGPINSMNAAALANALPEQVASYCNFLEDQDQHSTDYWPNVETYVSANLQNQ